LGVGEPKDILEAVERGMDMFDSVLPTRLGRHGSVWTKRGRVNLNNEKYKLDQNPIEKDCQCYTCQHFTQSYIRHLVHEKEILGMRLATIHNLYFIVNLMKNTREAIFEGRFTEFKKEFLGKFKN
nr:tRNA-guanine transglycosylase [Candidatus Aenigmarchaeota archaeon]